MAIPIALCDVFIISRMAKTKPVSYPVVSTEPAHSSVPKYPTMEYPLMNTPVYYAVTWGMVIIVHGSRRH